MTFLDHSVMQSRQKTCSQVCGVPTGCVVKRSRQMEHLSELPSELSELQPAGSPGARPGPAALPDESLAPSSSLSGGRRARRPATTALPLLLLPSDDSLTTCGTAQRQHLAKHSLHNPLTLQVPSGSEARPVLTRSRFLRALAAPTLSSLSEPELEPELTSTARRSRRRGAEPSELILKTRCAMRQRP